MMKNLALSTLTICGLHELDAHGARDVTHVLSLLDPGTPEPTAFSGYDPHVRTTLYFHDAIEPGPNIVLPEMSDIETILAFARDAGDVGHLLIHCHMEISRSTAAMLMVMAQAFPERPRGLPDRPADGDPAAGLAELPDDRFRRRAPRAQWTPHGGGRHDLWATTDQASRSWGGDGQAGSGSRGRSRPGDPDRRCVVDFFVIPSLP